MKMFEEDVAPCWYELSFDRKTPAILLKVHKDFAKNVEAIPKSAPIVGQFMKEFGFSDFVGNLDANFGFDGALERKSDQGDFIVLEVKIPEIEKLSRNICERCNGTGKDEWEEKCLNCKGIGRETEFDWQKAYSISASLAVFFELALLYEKKTSCPFPQLMTVETYVSRHQASIDGTYGIDLAGWLSRRTGVNTEITEMTEAMKIAYRRIYPDFDGSKNQLVLFETKDAPPEDYDDYQFYAKIASENGWLNVSCPGDRCGLHPADQYEVGRGKGYRFSCHNVDSPMQQITLLAGLAALHDKVRKEIRLRFAKYL